MIKIGTYDGYIATPSAEKAHKDAGVLLVPNVLGIWQNSQLIADQFAANGYLCLIIDVFEGDAVPLNQLEDFDLASWREKHGKPQVDPIMDTAVRFLKQEKGVKKLGGVGYCVGAKVGVPLRI
jgi:dienelactone hydrolase